MQPEELADLESSLLAIIHMIDAILVNEEMVEKQTLKHPGPYMNPLANRLDDIQGQIQQEWIHAGRLKKRLLASLEVSPKSD